MDDELFYEVLLDDGVKYSYSVLNTNKIRSDLTSIPSSGNIKLDHAIADEAWLDAAEGTKFGCQVEAAPENGFAFYSNDKELLRINGDESSVWRLGDWIVNVDTKMVPISIMVPTSVEEQVYRKGHHGFEQLASIIGLELLDSNDVTFDRCNPDSAEADETPQVSDEAHERLLRIMDAHDPSIPDEEYFAQEESRATGHRKLETWLNDLAQLSSFTQWCGLAVDEKYTPCPDALRKDVLYDFNADNACRRHVYGKKKQVSYLGFLRHECQVDKDLVDAGGHNHVIQAAYGDLGGAMVIGCFNYQAYNCFHFKGSKLRFGYCGTRWITRLGPFRYVGATKYEGYVRGITCPYDYLLEWW